MRIECGSVDEFFDELEHEASSGRVYKGLIRFRVDIDPQQDEQVSFDVVVFLTALIGDEKEGVWQVEYLLQVAARAGIDEADRQEGTETVKLWEADLKEIARQHNLTIRKGRYELF